MTDFYLNDSAKFILKFKSPSFSTLVTGAMVAIPALFMNLQEVTDLSSIGTLFAFVLVNAGVIQMETHRNQNHVGFRVPYYNGRLFIPLLCLISLFVFIVFDTSDVFFHLNERENWPAAIFWIMFITLSVLSYKYRYSVIPVLGMVSNFYLMTQLNFTNWAAFIVWLLIGLIVYFLYGYRHSKLNKPV